MATNEPVAGHIAWDGTRTPLKTALFLVICVTWLLPGLVGHDPWKFDEAVVFGVVTEILRSGDWINFRIAGEPYFGKAPLFVWTAALLAKLFGGILTSHDAARLAAGIYMAATLTFLSRAGREILGQRGVRVAVLLFVGCLGLLIRAHEMNTDLAGLTGVAMALNGVAMMQRRPHAGAILTGAAIGVAFLGNGFLPAGMIVFMLVILPAIGTAWRTPAYARSVGLALAVAVPLLALWPLALSASGPGALGEWMEHAAASRWTDSGVHDPLEIFYFARSLPWYGWPAWPLAAWALWRSRRTLLDRRELMLPLAAFIAFFLVASLMADARDVNGLALLLPLAILGAAELDSLPRGAASALDWFGMMTFLSLAAMLWVGFFAATTGRPEFAVAWLQKEVPGFTYHFSFVSCALAALLTLIWIVVVARSLRSTRRAIVNWAAGITMSWMLMMTIGLPFVDQARSYRALSARVVGELPRDFKCIARRNLGDPQRALLDYFANIETVAEESPAAHPCQALLVQAAPLKIHDAGPEWEEIWRGSRPGDRHELFILYRRKNAVGFDFIEPPSTIRKSSLTPFFPRGPRSSA
jgi:4-amino-4-deoxy-L-arabinose transferase-like glycosyltransferase